MKELKFFLPALFNIKSILGKQLKVLGLLILLIIPISVYGTITVDGTPEQRDQIAKWLTRSLGATVTIESNGTMSIGDGGNASATRLRNMINDAGTSVTIKAVENDERVNHGYWNSSTDDSRGSSTGIQTVDVGDLAAIGNVINSYGITPDFFLMHEITEVYEGKKGGLGYLSAHVKGIEAERELMSAHGTELKFRGVQFRGKFAFAKIKRPDGTYVVVRFDLDKARLEGDWFKESVPCRFEPKKFIAIADPDPQVHIFNYNYDLNHSYSNAIDTSNSRPTGVAFDDSLNLYIIENHIKEQDEIRVFTSSGMLINTIRNAQLIDPEGIDIDKVSGDIFVAVQGKILRFDKSGSLLGSYYPAHSEFSPTDVSIWTNHPTWGLTGDGKIYDIFVSDKALSQVYRFNVQQDMDAGTYVNIFGGEVLDAPEGIQVDDWQTIWVASSGNNRIYCFTPSGNIVTFSNNPYFIEDATKKFLDMARVRDEGVYVLDGTPGNGALLLYNFDGELIKTYGEEKLQCPTSLATGFSLDLNNLTGIADPGGDEESEDGVITNIFLIGFALFLIIALIFYLMKRKKNGKE